MPHVGAVSRFFRPGASVLLGIVGALAPRRVPRIGPPSSVSSILVLRVDERVGNVLLTTPLLTRLVERFPEAKVRWLVARSKRGLVEGLFDTIPFEKKDFFRRPWRFLAQLWALRRARYDVAIDASHWHSFSATSALLLGLIGAKIRIAHDRGAARLVATDLVPVPEPSAREPEIQSKLRLLSPLGIEAGQPRMVTAAGQSAESKRDIDAWLSAQALSDVPLLALSPGGRKEAHRMPRALFTEIAGLGRALGATPIVLWGPGEEALASTLAEEAGAKLAPATDLDGLAALMRRCRAVVVNDTGPMHLSVALGTPTIALFAQPAEWRWGHHYAPHTMIAGAGREQREILAEVDTALRRLLC